MNDFDEPIPRVIGVVILLECPIGLDQISRIVVGSLVHRTANLRQFVGLVVQAGPFVIRANHKLPILIGIVDGKGPVAERIE